MPIYEYEPESGSCAICKGRFELNRPASRDELVQCPLCKKPVRRVISTVNSPRHLKPLSVSDAKKVGFQIFERREKGVYERL